MNFRIGTVERDTGLSKDTLRIWEKRYGFPLPGRDAQGERVYTTDQVDKLRLLKRLVDLGYRPSKIIGLELAGLRELVDRSGIVSLAAGRLEENRDDLRRYLEICKSHRFEELRRVFSREILRLGLYRFVVQVIAPLNTIIGSQWAGGNMAVFEEHLYTESVQIVLRSAIAAVATHSDPEGMRPRVLLTTFPYEQHGLGLLMVEAILALEGATCVSLGTQTPVMDIVNAAKRQDIDIVALSFSEAANGSHALEDLQELRASLPAGLDIWAGGNCMLLHRRPPDGVSTLALEDIPERLAAWRTRQSVTQA